MFWGLGPERYITVTILTARCCDWCFRCKLLRKDGGSRMPNFNLVWPTLEVFRYVSDRTRTLLTYLGTRILKGSMWWGAGFVRKREAGNPCVSHDSCWGHIITIIIIITSACVKKLIFKCARLQNRTRVFVLVLFCVYRLCACLLTERNGKKFVTKEARDLAGCSWVAEFADQFHFLGSVSLLRHLTCSCCCFHNWLQMNILQYIST